MTEVLIRNGQPVFAYSYVLRPGDGGAQVVSLRNEGERLVDPIVSLTLVGATALDGALDLRPTGTGSFSIEVTPVPAETQFLATIGNELLEPPDIVNPGEPGVVEPPILVPDPEDPPIPEPDPDDSIPPPEDGAAFLEPVFVEALLDYADTFEPGEVLLEFVFPASVAGAGGGGLLGLRVDGSEEATAPFPDLSGASLDPGEAVPVFGAVVALPGDRDYQGTNFVDALIFPEDSDNYLIQFQSEGVVRVRDLTAGEGVVGEDAAGELRQIDELEFDDGFEFVSEGRIDLNAVNGIVELPEADLLTFTEMYIAYFDRAPDAFGLYYWGTRLTDGMSLEMIAESFFEAPESQAAFPDADDDAALVNAAYTNLLGRDAEQEGFDYWTSELASGEVTRGQFMLAIINGAKAETGSAADAAVIEDKGKIGLYYAVIKGLSDTDDAASVMQIYDRDAAASTLQDARLAIDALTAEATDDDGVDDALTIPIVGVFDTPFPDLVL